MKKFGFKLFSTNLQTAPSLVEECADFVADKQDMFIELMVVPTSAKEDFHVMKQKLKDIEVRIHAPHKALGFDTGSKEFEEQNKKLFALTQYAADIFDAKSIVVHAGCGHGKQYMDETVRQFIMLNDKRIVVENLHHSINGVARHGNTAEEISYIMRETGCGFCFDFSHAICAALSLNIDIETQLKSFYDLNPTVYHICDGDINKAEDAHMHCGTGNYNLQHFVNNYTADDAYITIETGKGVLQHNNLWVKDYRYLKSL